jgi:hypothetical protein
LNDVGDGDFCWCSSQEITAVATSLSVNEFSPSQVLENLFEKSGRNFLSLCDLSNLSRFAIAVKSNIEESKCCVAASG